MARIASLRRDEYCRVPMGEPGILVDQHREPFIVRELYEGQSEIGRRRKCVRGGRRHNIFVPILSPEYDHQTSLEDETCSVEQSDNHSASQNPARKQTK